MHARFLASIALLGVALGAGAGEPTHHEAVPLNDIVGTWIYAKDPTGALPSEAIYEGSTITFGADGSYAFQLGETRIALRGTWESRGADADTVRVHTEYGQGRRNDLALTLRRGPDGGVVGMEVREGDASTPARFYAPRTD